MKLSYLSLLALMAVAVMATALVLESQNDTRQTIALTEQMMVSQGQAIAEIVAEASLHGFDAYTSWVKESEEHLKDNAKWLAWANRKSELSEKDLDIFARDLGLWRILFFDRQGKLEKSSRNAAGAGNLDPAIPTEFIFSVATSSQPAEVLGFRRASGDGVPRLVVGARRPDGGAVIVCARTADMDRTRMEIGPGHLIRTMGESPGVHYVVLQNSAGIIAASTAEVQFPLPVADPGLEPLQEGQDHVIREFDSPLGPVLEVCRVMKVGAGDGKGVLLRVGLDSRLLADMRTDTRNRGRLRILTMAASLVLVSVLLLAWQRQMVLRREVRKVTNELRMREEEAQRAGKLVAMGNLAAGVAHEIRNPLNTIHMLAQALGRDRELPGQITEKARHIRDESARIEGIVQQFLDFARPREPVLERLNLGQVVRETVAMHQAAHQQNGLVFQLEAPDCQAHLDRHFVVEVVDNLVRNAVEALDGQGTVAVTLTCHKEWAELVVEDDGPGIPPESREKVFDLYFTTKPSGSGLGLSLVSRMVTAMEGHFSLDPDGSSLGGARFLVRFSLQRSQA